MFKLKQILCAAIVASSATSMASAQSTTGTFTSAPFVVGDPSVFAASILNLNLQNFFGGSRSYLLGNNSGSASQGGIGTTATSFGAISGNNGNSTTGNTAVNVSSAKTFVLSPYNINYTGNATRQSLAANAFGTNVSTSTIVTVLTALTDSPNPRTGSAGVLFQGLNNSTISSVSFQYSPISTVNGFSGSDLSVAPYLAIDDVSNGVTRTRYIPISSGFVVSNAALNSYNNVGTTTSTGTAAIQDNSFLTVTFNSAQLGIRGTVSKIGLVLFKKGIVFVNNITVNGRTSTGTVAQNSTTYPF